MYLCQALAWCLHALSPYHPRHHKALRDTLRHSEQPDRLRWPCLRHHRLPTFLALSLLLTPTNFTKIYAIGLGAGIIIHEEYA